MRETRWVHRARICVQYTIWLHGKTTHKVLALLVLGLWNTHSWGGELHSALRLYLEINANTQTAFGNDSSAVFAEIAVAVVRYTVECVIPSTQRLGHRDISRWLIAQPLWVIASIFSSGENGSDSRKRSDKMNICTGIRLSVEFQCDNKMLMLHKVLSVRYEHLC